jgi:uncharacterized protein (TIGR03382 family)
VGAGRFELSGTVVVRAYTYQFTAEDIGTTVLVYLTRDAENQLVVDQRITRTTFAQMDCFDETVPVAEIADVVLADTCYQTLPHDVDGCPSNPPFGCSTGGMPGSIALLVVGLVLWRRRR